MCRLDCMAEVQLLEEKFAIPPRFDVRAYLAEQAEVTRMYAATVMGFGPTVVVEDPPELREMVQTWAQAGVGLYRTL